MKRSMISSTGDKPFKGVARAVVVEDDEFVAATIAARLARKDVEAICFTTATSAITFLKKKKVAFAIVDLGLPDGNGLDLISEIRRTTTNAGIPIIIATSNHDERVAMEAYEDGGILLVSHKPIDWACLEYVLDGTVLDPRLDSRACA